MGRHRSIHISWQVLMFFMTSRKKRKKHNLLESSFVLCRKFCKEKSWPSSFLLHPFPRYIDILQAHFSPQKRNIKLLTTAYSSLCNLSYRQVSYARRKFRMIKLFYHPLSPAVRPFLLLPGLYLCIWLLLLESWQGFQGRLQSSQIHLNRWFPSWWLAGINLAIYSPSREMDSPFQPCNPRKLLTCQSPWYTEVHGYTAKHTSGFR